MFVSGDDFIGLYLHIPFCKSKCAYCDFCSFAHRETEFGAYLDAIKKEIDLVSPSVADKIIKTIYIGGGTPSYFSAAMLTEIIRHIRKRFVVLSDAEFTIEGNPDSVNENFVKAMRDAGVNRFSLGLQTASDKLLKTVCRPHTFKQFCMAAETIGKRCDNVNVDVMLGLPQQTEKDVTDTLNVVCGYDFVKHVSAYGLILEKGTPLFKAVKTKKVTLPDDDAVTDFYDKTAYLLDKNGFARYEVSNFAKKGFECKHNLNYWDWGQYVGIGLAAHSFVGGSRYANTKKFDLYYKRLGQNKLPVTSKKRITGQEAAFEYVMLNLRKTEGFELNDFKNRFGDDFLTVYKAQTDYLFSNKMLKQKDGKVFVPPQKIYLLNSVLVEFVPEKEKRI